MWFEREEKMNNLFTGLGSVLIVKNYDLGPKNTSVTVFSYTDLPAGK